MALHIAGSPIPSTAQSLLPMPSAGTSKDPESRSLLSGQGALCSQEGRSFKGDMLNPTAGLGR